MGDDRYIRCETSSAAEQDLIHERLDSSQIVSAIENKAESFSKRLEGAENKFVGLQISCAGYVGMFNTLLKENKVLQYKIDKVDNEARNRNSENSSTCLRKLKQGKGVFSLHRGLRICTTGGGLIALISARGVPWKKQSILQESVTQHQWEAPRVWTISKVAQGWGINSPICSPLLLPG